jgi:hypothetical protein
MPKGDPKGGRPRRMERQHEAMLRAGLRQAGVATRYDRVGPFLRMFVAHRDAMLARYPSPFRASVGGPHPVGHGDGC